MVEAPAAGGGEHHQRRRQHDEQFARRRRRHLEETQWAAPFAVSATRLSPDALLDLAAASIDGVGAVPRTHVIITSSPVAADAARSTDAVRAGVLEVRVVGVDLPATAAGRAAYVRAEVAPGNAAAQTAARRVPHVALSGDPGSAVGWATSTAAQRAARTRGHPSPWDCDTLELPYAHFEAAATAANDDSDADEEGGNTAAAAAAVAGGGAWSWPVLSVTLCERDALSGHARAVARGELAVGALLEVAGARTLAQLSRNGGIGGEGGGGYGDGHVDSAECVPQTPQCRLALEPQWVELRAGACTAPAPSAGFAEDRGRVRLAVAFHAGEITAEERAVRAAAADATAAAQARAAAAAAEAAAVADAAVSAVAVGTDAGKDVDKYTAATEADAGATCAAASTDNGGTGLANVEEVAPGPGRRSWFAGSKAFVADVAAAHALEAREARHIFVLIFVQFVWK